MGSAGDRKIGMDEEHVAVTSRKITTSAEDVNVLHTTTKAALDDSGSGHVGSSAQALSELSSRWAATGRRHTDRIDTFGRNVGDAGVTDDQHQRGERAAAPRSPQRLARRRSLPAAAPSPGRPRFRTSPRSFPGRTAWVRRNSVSTPPTISGGNGAKIGETGHRDPSQRQANVSPSRSSTGWRLNAPQSH